MCGLSLAWVTNKNSTKLLESDSSWLTVAGPYLLCYCLPSPVLTAPVRGSTPTLCCSPLSCPAPTALRRVARQLLSFASPSHFRIRRDFRSKNPLSGFAPKQTNESSALAAHPHSATEVHSNRVLQAWTEVSHQNFGGWEEQTIWNLQKNVWCIWRSMV